MFAPRMFASSSLKNPSSSLYISRISLLLCTDPSTSRAILCCCQTLDFCCNNKQVSIKNVKNRYQSNKKIPHLALHQAGYQLLPHTAQQLRNLSVDAQVLCLTSIVHKFRKKFHRQKITGLITCSLHHILRKLLNQLKIVLLTIKKKTTVHRAKHLMM